MTVQKRYNKNNDLSVTDRKNFTFKEDFANEKTFDQHGSGGQYGSQHHACPCFCVGGGSNLKL